MCNKESECLSQRDRESNGGNYENGLHSSALDSKNSLAEWAIPDNTKTCIYGALTAQKC
jgi:hypothetical protein